MNSAKIIAITQPLIYNDAGIRLTPSEFLAYTARVSNPSNQMNTMTAPKLIKYLINNAHWSVFEMVSITIEVETTRDIARQLLRHRSFSFQEFSQRYADPTKDLGFEIREARLQDHKNRQNSIDTDDEDLKLSWKLKQEQLIHESQLAYKWAIEKGIAKEQARSVLPEGLTVSRLYAAGTLRSWYHYCQLRMDNGTQKEHMELAKSCWEAILEEFPILNEL